MELVLVLDVEDLVVLHEVNLKEHILCVSDEGLADEGRLFVSLQLRVQLASVEALLVGVDLGFDLAARDQLGQL